MVQLPRLGTIPPFYNELSLKATGSGIVVLKDSRFKSRYVGSKFSAVDVRGRLWPRAADLQAIEAGNKLLREGAKKNPVKKPGKKLSTSICNASDVGVQISENLLTQQTDISTKKTDLSTVKPRLYSVNKQLVRQRLLGYINTMKGEKELYFWTVTFFEGMPDDKAYQVFNIWLTSLRQYGMLKEYLWVAERQQNNTIHFHIAIPHKMPVYKANAMMAGTLKTFAKRGEIPVTVYQCRKYNGVDIAKNRNTKRVTNFAVKKGVRSLTIYLTKYVTKNSGFFTHLAWHNSRGYSAIFTGVTFTIPEFISYGFNLLIDRRKRIDTEFFTFIPWQDTGPPRLLMDHLYKLNSYLQTQLN